VLITTSGQTPPLQPRPGRAGTWTRSLCLGVQTHPQTAQPTPCRALPVRRVSLTQEVSPFSALAATAMEPAATARKLGAGPNQVCACVWMCVYLCAWVWQPARISTFSNWEQSAQVRILVHVCTSVFAHIHTRVRMFLRTCACILVRIRVFGEGGGMHVCVPARPALRPEGGCSPSCLM